MSTRILILKDGVTTIPRSSTDINNIKNSLGVVDLTTNQTITGNKTFSGGLILPNSVGTSISSIWRNVDNLEYKDSANITKILLNSAGNLSNLSNKQTALNNLVENQTANRVLRSNGVNVLLAQVGLTTDVTGILPIASGGTGSSTQNFVDLTTDQNIAGIKTFSSPLVISNTTASTSTTTGALRISAGGGSVVGNWYVGGFTSLGDNIAIKVKRLTGTTASTEGGFTNVATDGVALDKIVGFQCLVNFQAGGYMGPNHVNFAGFQYDIYINGAFVILNSATNSESILSKPISILMFYTS